jgi:hypothetical protein
VDQKDDLLFRLPECHLEPESTDFLHSDLVVWRAQWPHSNIGREQENGDEDGNGGRSIFIQSYKWRRFELRALRLATSRISFFPTWGEDVDLLDL